MSIETLDDIVEEIADSLGVYGVCPGSEDCAGHCRPEFTANLKSRINAAVDVERKLEDSHEALGSEAKR